MESLRPSFAAAAEASVTLVGSRSSERKGEFETIEMMLFPNASEVMFVMPILSCTGPLISPLPEVLRVSTNC